jgi:TolB-like protein/tetratricopeptide (TPR) repeat protein
VGYRFAAPVFTGTAEVEETPEILPGVSPSTPYADYGARAQESGDDSTGHPENAGSVSIPERRPIFRRLQIAGWRPVWLIPLCCVLLLCVLTAPALRYRHTLGRVSSATAAPPQVALLPFTNLSGAPDQAWVSSALRETLFTDLTAGTGLRMTPQDDVLRAQRELHLAEDDNLSRQNLGRLCRDVDCDQVVTGSYLVSGGQVRVDARLTDAVTGDTLLTLSRTGPADHLLPLIEDTSAAVRRTLGLRQDGSGSAEALNASTSSNPEAYKLYLQGLDALRDYDGSSATSLDRRSIALDAAFPLAHLALSSGYTILGQEQEAVAEAKQAKALDARLSREQQLQIDARLASAERRFEDAANVTHSLYTFYPDKPEYLMQTAAELSYGGQPAKAIEMLRPLTNAPEAANDPQLDSIVADCYSLMGDWPHSLTWARNGAEASQRRGAAVLYGRLLTTEAQALLYLHRPEEALEESQQALSIARDFSDSSGEMRALNRIGQVPTQLGHLSEAETVLSQALALERRQGELQRQLHTLSALGNLRSRQGDSAGARAFFQQELSVAMQFRQPDFTLGAQLDVAREEWLVYHDQRARLALEHVQAQAVAIHDQEIQVQAQMALLGK